MHITICIFCPVDRTETWVLNTTFNNIFDVSLSWALVLLVEETDVPGGYTVTSH